MTTDTLIIGAGIYGIALANQLNSQNSSFLVVGKYMDLWRNHTFQNMKLRSDFRTSEIFHPGRRYSADRFLEARTDLESYRYVHLPVRIYRQYLDWVEAGLEFPVCDDIVINLEKDEAGRFMAVLKSGREISCTRAVVATGLSTYTFIPALNIANRKAGKNILHSYETEKIEKIKNSNVLVIGAGQSAAEAIDNLKSQGNLVLWYKRHRPVFLEQPVNIPAWLFHFIIKSAAVFSKIPYGLRKLILRAPITSTFEFWLW